MTKKELIEARKAEHKLAYGKYKIGSTHTLNDPPTNKEEANQHGNALAASGNYPVGTSECFNVGISGGCGPECYIYLNGRCDEPQEMLATLDHKGLVLHAAIYPVNDQGLQSQPVAVGR